MRCGKHFDIMKNKKENPLLKFLKNPPNMDYDIKDKFINILPGLIVNILVKENCEFNEEILEFFYKNDEDLPILKEKMNNVIKILNDMEPEERIVFLKQEIDDDLWKTF